jgi:hypothetical protein
MGGIWLGVPRSAAALAVETPNLHGIGGPAFGGRRILDAMALPQPARIAKVFSPLSALTPAPVRTKTQSPGPIWIWFFCSFIHYLVSGEFLVVSGELIVVSFELSVVNDAGARASVLPSRLPTPCFLLS